MARRWPADAQDRLSRGADQIGKILRHAKTETAKAKVSAVVFVGDAMEESADTLCARAGELGLCGVPVFVFQEGDDAAAANTFRQIAKTFQRRVLPLQPGLGKGTGGSFTRGLRLRRRRASGHWKPRRRPAARACCSSS